MSQHAQFVPPSAPRQPRRWPWVLGIVAALVIGIVIGSAGSSPTPSPAPIAAAAPVAPVVQPPAAAPVQAAPAVEEAPAVQTGPATTIGDCSGCEVGVDLAPGRYKTPGPDKSSIIPMCYWKRAKNDSGELDAIIANQNIQGPGAVTLKQGEYVDFSGGCTWTKE